MTWYVWLIVGFIFGYIAKDIMTVEKKVEVTIGKVKQKGKGNDLDSDYDINVDEKKERRKWFKKRNLD